MIPKEKQKSEKHENYKNSKKIVCVYAIKKSENIKKIK